MARNISKVYLLDVPMEDDLKNTLYFASASAQQTYFQSVIGKTYTDVSYQSETRTFRCKDELEVVRQYNYIMWQNTAYSNKWFYGFITKATHVSDGLTDIEFEVDPIQTFMFDITIKPSFIEREHCNDDTVGLHTLAENFDLGDYQINSSTIISMVSSDGTVPSGHTPWYVCFCVTEQPDPNNPIPIAPVTGYDVGAVYTPLKFFAVSTANGFADANWVLNWYKRSHTSIDTAIINMYMIPHSCVDFTNTQTWTDTTVTPSVSHTVYAVLSSTTLPTTDISESKNMSGVYRPRNAKLYTYPYCYLYLDNKCGESVIYHWEDGQTINTGTQQEPDYQKYFSFKGIAVPSASISAKLFPTVYKGLNETSPYYGALNYGINFGKVPVCAWTNDYYTNWLTQNGVNMATNVGLGIAGVGLGLATGGLGLVAGGLSLANTIGDVVGEKHRAETTPPQAQGNVNTGDVTFAYTFNNIIAYQMTVKKEVSQVIDSYFDMFGYKANVVKAPNVAHRQNWWYTKTIGANIVGNVPNDYMTKIKKAYDDGITYWRTPANFLDYSKPNGIV
ncbi:MAG: hypothetical protein J6S85_10800 [Methanobrevibacter sp.]|nr:hypothetical protein [Methanobrevibacter sp.]